LESFLSKEWLSNELIMALKSQIKGELHPKTLFVIGTNCAIKSRAEKTTNSGMKQVLETAFSVNYISQSF